MNYWARKLSFGASLLIGLHSAAHAVYVDGNPLSLADPNGLTAADVRIIDNYVSNNMGDIHRRNGYEFGPVGADRRGETDPFSGTTTLPPWIKCKILTESEFFDLFQTVLHESMHSTDPWYRVMADAWRQPANTDNHEGINNRVVYETLNGHRFAPPGPMWGKPSSFIPRIGDLYRQTRQEGNQTTCECK